MSELVEFLRKWLDEDEEFWKGELDDLVMGGIAERMLAQVEAHRRIVDECTDRIESGRGDDGQVMTSGGNLGLEVLAILGTAYADRPGYREEWRP